MLKVILLLLFHRLFGGKDMESIFNALESDGSEWAIKQLELLNKMVFFFLFFDSIFFKRQTKQTKLPQ